MIRSSCSSPRPFLVAEVRDRPPDPFRQHEHEEHPGQSEDEEEEVIRRHALVLSA